MGIVVNHKLVKLMFANGVNIWFHYDWKKFKHIWNQCFICNVLRWKFNRNYGEKLGRLRRKPSASPTGTWLVGQTISLFGRKTTLTLKSSGPSLFMKRWERRHTWHISALKTWVVSKISTEFISFLTPLLKPLKCTKNETFHDCIFYFGNIIMNLKVLEYLYLPAVCRTFSLIPINFFLKKSSNNNLYYKNRYWRLFKKVLK